jgi:hypothetical protein
LVTRDGSLVVEAISRAQNLSPAPARRACRNQAGSRSYLQALNL